MLVNNTELHMKLARLALRSFKAEAKTGNYGAFNAVIEC